MRISLGHDCRHVNLRPRSLSHANNCAGRLNDFERRRGGFRAAGGFEDDVEGSLSLGVGRETLSLLCNIDRLIRPAIRGHPQGFVYEVGDRDRTRAGAPRDKHRDHPDRARSEHKNLFAEQ